MEHKDPAIELWDDDTSLHFAGYAGGASPGGALSEITLLHKRADGNFMLRYSLVGIEPAPEVATPEVVEQMASNSGMSVRLKTVMLYHADGAKQFEISGTGVIRNHEPNYYIEFSIERQAMGGDIKLKVGDSTIWTGLDPDQRMMLARDIKNRVKGQIEQRVQEVLLAKLGLNVEAVKKG